MSLPSNPKGTKGYVCVCGGGGGGRDLIVRYASCVCVWGGGGGDKAEHFQFSGGFEGLFETGFTL